MDCHSWIYNFSAFLKKTKIKSHLTEIQKFIQKSKFIPCFNEEQGTAENLFCQEDKVLHNTRKIQLCISSFVSKPGSCNVG